jgi:hypothetical protein
LLKLIRRKGAAKNSHLNEFFWSKSYADVALASVGRRCGKSTGRINRTDCEGADFDIVFGADEKSKHQENQI